MEQNIGTKRKNSKTISNNTIFEEIESKDNLGNEVNKNFNFFQEELKNLISITSNSQNIYPIKINDNIYLIKLDIISNSLRIIIHNKDEETKSSEISIYQKIFTLDDLKIINKVFRLCDSIEETIDFFEEGLKNQENTPKIELLNDFFKISIKFNNRHLPKKDMSDFICLEIPKLTIDGIKLSKNNNTIKNNSIFTEKEDNYDNLINSNFVGNNGSTVFNDCKKNNSNNKQHLQIKKLFEDNSKLKNRLNVLEEHNNKMVQIIKDTYNNQEKRISALEGQYKNISNILNKYKELFIKEDNKINQRKVKLDTEIQKELIKGLDNNNKKELNAGSNNPNFFGRIIEEQKKIKEKNKKEKEEKEKKQENVGKIEQNKIDNNFMEIDISQNDREIKKKDEEAEDDEQNYLYNSKNDDDKINDDMGLIVNNGIGNNYNSSPTTPISQYFNNINKKENYYNKNNSLEKNIMSIDENEEEKKNLSLNKENYKKTNENKWLSSYNLGGGPHIESRQIAITSNEYNVQRKSNCYNQDYNHSSYSLNNLFVNNNNMISIKRCVSGDNISQEKENEKNLSYQLTSRSRILSEKGEYDFIIKYILNYLKKECREILRIFRASQDGDKAETFHRLCDNAPNLLIVISTENGKKFGGFTSRGFDSSNSSQIDDSAFIFSLDKKEIYSVMKGYPAIDCFLNMGPSFSGNNITIYDNFFSHPSSSAPKGNNYQTKEDFQINGGERFFKIKELEILRLVMYSNN